MAHKAGMSPTRRQVLAGGLALGGAAALGGVPAQALGAAPGSRLEAALARVAILGLDWPETDAWAFGGRVPGQTLRVRRGEEVDVILSNALAEDTTIHWHGLRLPNAMDGVPHVTQAPVAPGETFRYRFTAPDAGTFWYHPHSRSYEQVARGLFGALVVEEETPPAVDRDLLWVLADFRMTRDGAIAEDFDNRHDLTHAGRLGNTVTINGMVPHEEGVRAGERVRLRLVNAAVARGFTLRFGDMRPAVIALDGQPVPVHAAPGGRIVLTPGQRADLILDFRGDPEDVVEVVDEHYRGQAYRLVTLRYRQEWPLRTQFAETPSLTLNPLLAEPDFDRAETYVVEMGGGMMSGMSSAIVDGQDTGLREMVMRHGLAWAINGIAMTHDHLAQPLMTLGLGRSYVLDFRNDTAFEHPMHLHGHHFRVLRVNGEKVPHAPWRDTVNVPPRGRAEVAFVADNPGDWMLHCHVLAHQHGGMMGLVRVD
ncbi:MAG: multicopper oxidase family protein [Alphaproteobacteria bacterium]|nr:multicopper oxidase family protein [Alphaproteobacteria bacterium]MDX5368713.1 multicopper oxidase family protein [Alphaproteobacteria bacterium]MDX5463455.1 multicopper oxidase family protein [Alphaproteobacteria bacterium]